MRRVGRFGAELLGSGDIVRPWEHDGETTVPFDTTWRVLAPTRLAVLDLAWARRLAPFPEIAGTLIGRAMERSRRLAVNMAIAQHPCLGVRLEVLLWHLAERLGRVHTDGVHLTLPVTHETLGNLVAARRPPPAARRCLSRWAAWPSGVSCAAMATGGSCSATHPTTSKACERLRT